MQANAYTILVACESPFNIWKKLQQLRKHCFGFCAVELTACRYGVSCKTACCLVHDNFFWLDFGAFGGISGFLNLFGAIFLPRRNTYIWYGPYSASFLFRNIVRSLVNECGWKVILLRWVCYVSIFESLIVKENCLQMMLKLFFAHCWKH